MPKVRDGTNYNKKYTEDVLQKALESIKNGMGVREASRTFKIPRATLQFRKSSKFKKPNCGPNPVLTAEEENLLVEWICENHRKGFPQRKVDVQASVKNFLDKNPRPNPFLNNCPGDGWYKAFLRRHPSITARTSEAVTSASSAVSEADIRKWFREIEIYLQSKGYDNILRDPCRILNGDETNFQLCPKLKKVLAPKGTKNVYEIEHAPSKTTLTVMFTFAASGIVTPPMIIYPYKRIPVNVLESVPDKWGIACTESGWMKAHIFYEYISNVLYPSLKEQNVQFPIILFLDGHCSHLTFQLSELCSRLDIVLICLYPNATRILQPADVAAFKPIKDGWRKSVQDWRRDNPNCTLTKDKFAPILKKVVDNYIKPETISRGFRACGLYPWNADAIDFSKCLGKNNCNSNIQNIVEDPQKKTEDEIRITLTTFKAIVGNEKIEKFKGYNTGKFMENDNENFYILYQLWKEFKAPLYSDSVSDDRNKIYNSTKHNNMVIVPDGSDLQQTAITDTILKTPTKDTPKYSILETSYPETVHYVFEPNSDGNRSFNSTGNNNMFSILDSSNLEQSEKTETVFENRIKGTSINNLVECNENDLFSHETRKEGNCNKNGDLFHEYDIDSQLLDIENMPVVIAEDVEINAQKLGENCVDSLQNVLYWPSTPQRKGKKDVERLPFVLTSTQWKRLKRDKEETKIEKERVKEVRRQQRLERRNTNKDKPVVMKAKTKKVPEKMEQVTKRLFQEELSTKGDAQNSPKEKITDKQASEGARKNINILSDITVSNETLPFNDILIKTGLVISRNVKLLKGLCFCCAFNMSKEKYGIKCKSCSRSYHLICIYKNNLHKSNSSVFECSVCLKNKFV